MSINLSWILLIILVLVYLIIILLLRIISNKFSSLDELYKRNNRRLSTILSLVNHSFKGTFESLREIKDIKQNLIIEDLEEQLQNKALIRIQNQEIKKLKSFNATRRKEASVYLGLIGSLDARVALEKSLIREKDASVKIYISNALTDIRNLKAIPIMIEALLGSHKWYREKAISNILEFGRDLQGYFDGLISTNDIEHLELCVKYAGENFNEQTKAFLFSFIHNYETKLEEMKVYYAQLAAGKGRVYKAAYLVSDFEDILELACRTAANYYYTDFSKSEYYESSKFVVKKNAFWALSKSNNTEHFKILLSHLHEDQFEKTLIVTMTYMVEMNPRFLYVLEEAFQESSDEIIRQRIAQVFSNKLEYYILKLGSKRSDYVKAIIKQVILNGKINELIGFLNLNKDKDIENALLEIISECIEPDSELGKELRTYLKEELLEKWGVVRCQIPVSENIYEKDQKLIHAVMSITVLGVIFFPFFYIMRMLFLGGYETNWMLIKQYVIEFNYLLAYYSLTINISYLSLMCLSYLNVRKQAKLWNLKNISMLFRNKMIPTISIIAPAFNEEGSIVSNVRSLLNLKYPEYELIVVNDGSKDDTLNQLIETFKLVRVDYQYKKSLDTAPIRGIYRNPSLPRLVVIDKSNGGKADALNAGINVANKEYFCGIDADSLLEPEALLRLASLTLDESTETPALGGNIHPINSCKVDKGLITEVNLPQNVLAKFQTIEYIRAFMAGRMGWQRINSLLIISGAFGLFRKDRIIAVGGYLTKKSVYKKDTVGEDMEIVVRITRRMYEQKHPFKVQYAFNANCWTEVPEDIKSLRNQRFRWHRGLIDILFFHRKMLFNPKYGRTGTFVLPYFIVFEAIGPMIEFQGYLMVCLAALLGILNLKIFLLLFASTILLGIMVSLSSLLIAEREEQIYSVKDILILLLYAIIENFGPRQLFTFWRIHGQIKMIYGQSGWASARRKGIKS